MRNTIRSQQTVTEEEVRKIMDLDWNSYYRESLPPEMQGMVSCGECGAILINREDQTELKCYSCGHIFKAGNGG